MPLLPPATDLGEGRGDRFLGVERQVGIADSGQQQQEAFCLCAFGVRLSSDHEKLSPREARSLEAPSSAANMMTESEPAGSRR